MKKNSLFQPSSNWLGRLELHFSIKYGRSVLVKRNHSGPFFVQRSFYPEDDKTIPHVYLLHPPGGLVGGDKLVLSVKLEPDSQAFLTTPGSAKFYRTNGMYAIQEYTFQLEDNSVLEWMPQSSIFFAKTKMKGSTVVELARGAKIISFEVLCFKGLNLNNFCINPEVVDISLNIYLPGSVGLRGRLKMDALDCFNKLHGFQISALLFAFPADEMILKQVRKLVYSIQNVQIGGVTLLDNLLFARLLSNDNQRLIASLYQIWSFIRPKIIGREVVMPRIWFT